MERNYPKILVTDKAARSLRSGHPWVYADEVLQADAACANGQIVDVTTRSVQDSCARALTQRE